MKTPPGKMNISGLTLFEVLLVVAVLAILAALLLPAGGGPSRTTRCMSNQKNLALGVIMFADDNTNQYPWQLSGATNGTKELITNGLAASQFRALEPYVKSFSVYVCPSDRVKKAATGYATFANTNLSYFVNVDATTNLPPADLFLTGDRNLMARSLAIAPGLFVYATNTMMNWSGEMHRGNKTSRGVIGFADGHVEMMQDSRLNTTFQRQGLATERLLVP